MATATLAWVDPTTDVNGNPLPSDFSINVFQAPSTTPIGVVAAGVQKFNTGPLAPGTYQFTLDTVDASGPSAMTPPATGVVSAALPNPPTNLTVTINP